MVPAVAIIMPMYRDSIMVTRQLRHQPPTGTGTRTRTRTGQPAPTPARGGAPLLARVTFNYSTLGTLAAF